MPPKPRKNAPDLPTSPHKWTVSERQTLLCLLVRNLHTSGLASTELENLARSTAPRHIHRNLPRSNTTLSTPGKLAYVDVATALNNVCHKFDYGNDIPVDDVREMVDKMLSDNKAAVLFTERQCTGRLTRSSNRVWKRKINYDGSKTEWLAGRKAAEEIKRREDEERRFNTGEAVILGSGANIGGVANGWDDGVVDAAGGGGWGTGDDELDKQPSSAEKVGAWGLGEAMDLNLPVTSADDPWGSADVTVNTGKAATINETDPFAADAGVSLAIPCTAMDSWSAGGVGPVASKAITNDWGVIGTSQETISDVPMATAAWGTVEDPFATPLPQRVSIAWGAPVPASLSNAQDSAAEDPFATPATSKVSNAWGAPVPESLSNSADSTAENPFTTPPTSRVSNAWGAPLPAILFDSRDSTAEDPFATPPTSKVSNAWGAPVPASLSNSWDSTAVGPTNPLGKTTPFRANTSNPRGKIEKASDGGESLFVEDQDDRPYSPSHVTQLESANSFSTRLANSAAVPGWGKPVTPGASSPAANNGRASPAQSGNPWGTPTASYFGRSESSTTFGHSKATSWDDVEPTPVPPRSVPVQVPAGWGATLKGMDDPFVDPPAPASFLRSTWGIVEEEISTPKAMNPSVGANASTTQNDKVDTVALSGVPIINAERLAMLESPDINSEDENHNTDFADGKWTGGEQIFRSKHAAISSDNAIPLKFNRLLGQRPGAGTEQKAKGDDDVDLMDYY